MRKILIVAMLSMVFAVPASAKVIQSGVVTTLNNAANSFTCHWKTSDWTFKTTSKTIFRNGRKPGSWSDLKVGETIQVTYHERGNDRIADRITIKVP